MQCRSFNVLSWASCSQSLIWIFNLTLEAPVNYQLISNSSMPVHPGSRAVVVVMKREQFLWLRSPVSHDCSRKQLKYCTNTTIRKYQKKVGKRHYMARIWCQLWWCILQPVQDIWKVTWTTGGVWAAKPFINWKKAVEKMKAHAKSDAHIKASQAALDYQSSLQLSSSSKMWQNENE